MPHTEQTALFKTLKANLFLLLYNLVESTVKNAIEAIFDEFKSQGVSFDDCREEVRRIVLANLKKHNVGKILPRLSTMSVDVVVATFIKNELFSGNVDGRRIREVATEYGFVTPNKKSDELLTVKTHRNDLAHGNKSFADVGRDFDLVRLKDIQGEVLAFLQELLANVASYITTRAYLAPKQRRPPTRKRPMKPEPATARSRRRKRSP
jgi:MAE_28990/MAE_18760-like HEPN